PSSLSSPPPICTLFPSPTLFRSPRFLELLVLEFLLDRDDLERHRAVDARVAGEVDGAHGAAPDAPLDHVAPEALRHAVGIRQRQDRKSTRLNSSHVKISYAVFCS